MILGKIRPQCKDQKPFNNLKAEPKNYLVFGKKSYVCHQNLDGKTIDTDASDISLSFTTTVNTANQFFSARLKTDEKYDY